MLSQTQREQYDEQGYLILKGAIAEHEIQRLERGVANNPPLDGTLDPNAPVYPAPGRYTLATQSARDPDLAFIIELIAGLLSIVPYLGTAVGIAAALIAAMFQDQDIFHPVMVLMVFAVGQSLESMVLTPKLVGDQVGLHRARRWRGPAMVLVVFQGNAAAVGSR